MMINNHKEELKQKNPLFIEDVRKKYGEKMILEDIDLSVRSGEFVTIVGPSGCGKSTLLRLILGQEFPTSGEILINQQPAGLADTRRGVVYQDYELLPNRTVLENVMIGKKLEAGIIGSWRKKSSILDEAMFYIEKARMLGSENKYPHELSGGMRQRVAIIQALIMKPQFLLMDEPFSGLDPGTREEMQVFILKRWEETKMNIFFITHDLEEAAYLGTRLIALSQYYTDDRGNDYKRGAKIVFDVRLGFKAQSTDIKKSAQFGEFIQQIREEAFNPKYLQYISDFNLNHPDSFETIDPEACKNHIC